MKLVNFRISDDNSGIETSNSKYFDLHNNFEFRDFFYGFTKRYFEVVWERRSENWVSKDDPKRLKMKFNNVQILRIKEIDQTSECLIEYPEDDLTLSIIGYTKQDDIEFLGYLTELDVNTEKYAITIQTQNGQAMVIYCDTVELEIQNN